jgi:hypothetical protein
MKLREAKRLVKGQTSASDAVSNAKPPVCWMAFIVTYKGVPLCATGTAICQPEDEWNEAVGLGIARSKAIAQLVQQVMTLDEIERKKAAMEATTRQVDEILADMTRRHESAQAAIKASSPYCQNRDEANQRMAEVLRDIAARQSEIVRGMIVQSNSPFTQKDDGAQEAGPLVLDQVEKMTPAFYAQVKKWMEDHPNSLRVTYPAWEDEPTADAGHE